MDLVKELKREMGIAQKRIKSLAGAIAALGDNSSIKKRRRRKPMSAASRAKMAAAQRARWAKVRTGKK